MQTSALVGNTCYAFMTYSGNVGTPPVIVFHKSELIDPKFPFFAHFPLFFPFFFPFSWGGYNTCITYLGHDDVQMSDFAFSGGSEILGTISPPFPAL